ncbi:MAG: lmo0937 family membrane protein [Oligoflexales bacterium]|nr:lmo0937 family membrane protein [Oligoflexales bacterium]
MLETIIVVLLVLWLLGALGPVAIPTISFNHNGTIHILLVVVIVLLFFRFRR